MSLLLALALYLPIFGPGPLTNLGAGDAAITNASAHIGWSLALPLAGHAVAGKRGALAAGGLWMVGSVVQEAAFHGRGSPAEVRTDLLSRLVPCAAVMVWELWTQ